MSNSKVEIDITDFDWSSKQTPEIRGRVFTIKIPIEYKDHEMIVFAIPMKTIDKTKFKTCKKCMTTNESNSKYCKNCGNEVEQ